MDNYRFSSVNEVQRSFTQIYNARNNIYPLKLIYIVCIVKECIIQAYMTAQRTTQDAPTTHKRHFAQAQNTTTHPDKIIDGTNSFPLSIKH